MSLAKVRAALQRSCCCGGGDGQVWLDCLFFFVFGWVIVVVVIVGVTREKRDGDDGKREKMERKCSVG